MKIEPYPFEWPRRLDFLTPLGYQVKVDSELPLYYCDAVVNTSAKLASDTFPTEYGRLLKVDSTNGTRVHYVKGALNVRKVDPEPVPQREILEDIFSGLGGAVEIPGIVLVQRGTIEKIPDKLRGDYPVLQTSESVLRQETRFGLFRRMLEQRLNLHLFNSYNWVKSNLLDRGYIKNPRDSGLRQLRGLLRTDWVLPEDKTIGYNNIKNEIVSLDMMLSANKWWEAIGYPFPFEGNVDHSLVRGQLYYLQQHDACTIV